MRRAGFALLLVCLACAGALAATVLAGTTRSTAAATETTADTSTTVPPAEPPSADTQASTEIGTTSEAPTVPVPVQPQPRPKPKPKLEPFRLSPEVTVGGVHVGGLTPAAAEAVVRTSFRSRLVLSVGGAQLSVSPARLGAIAYVKPAVAKARSARPGTRVPLVVAVHGAAVRFYVRSLAARWDRAPVDARAVLRGFKPVVVSGRDGLRIDRDRAVRAIVRTLEANARGPLTVPAKVLRQKVRPGSIASVIVIRRDTKWLSLYRGESLVRRFRVATGQSSFPTPVGRFRIVVKYRNPWWYPPSSSWARGLSPVPPGPGNPLGTRWMGLSAPGVGIHGTPDAASIGYSASHGCIRMYIPSAEWLFNHVAVGTPVFIVAA